MKNVRFGMLMAGVFMVGGTVFVSSTFAGTEPEKKLSATRQTAEALMPKKRVVAKVEPVQEAGAVKHEVALEAPPKNLPGAASARMVTSIGPVVPVTAANKEVTHAARPAKGKRAEKAVVAQAGAQKVEPKTLFTLVRMLNYAPHPLDEDLLRQAPLSLSGNNYWFNLKYNEDWKVLNDDEGYIKGISFEIDVMENNAKVRSMKTPKVAIDPAKIKKGQVLGVAEVAPYKFTISVEEFTRTKKGVSELVFKLDLVG
jgi:hypothetical protein